jgi:hypothetical protein
VQVTLQAGGVDLLYSAPMLSLHELYSMGRGQYATLAVRGCQTNDDAREQDAQTDEARPTPLASTRPTLPQS